MVHNARTDIRREAALRLFARTESAQQAATPTMPYPDLLSSVHHTAEDIGFYKPDPANFDHLLTHLRTDLGFERSDVVHTAQSLFHDHGPARSAGLANAWIDRQRLSEGGHWGATAPLPTRPEHDFLFFSMGEMAEAVRAEAG